MLLYCGVRLTYRRCLRNKSKWVLESHQIEILQCLEVVCESFFDCLVGERKHQSRTYELELFPYDFNIACSEHLFNLLVGEGMTAKLVD